MSIADTCKCYCGYTCGGPGQCEVFKEDAGECIRRHYRHDCEHVFDGPSVKIDGGGSVTCSRCGMTAMDHDIRVGP